MRYYIDPGQWSADEMTLAGEEAHHLLHVLRGEEEEELLLIDGHGREAVARIISTGRKEARLKVIQQRTYPPPALDLTLIQALPREQKMDVIIQKATELGVRHIAPVTSDNSVVRIKRGEDQNKIERWNKIALSAAKQSGCHWLPDIQPVMPLLDYLVAMPRFGAVITGSLEPDSRPIRDVIQAMKSNPPASIGVLIGPEGDLSSRELAAARNAGARMVSLGAQVLRSETAALYVMSILRYEFGP